METTTPSTSQPDLPYELWLSIINNCNYAARVSLSLVSQAFRQRSQPSLFRSITIIIRPSVYDPTITSDDILQRLGFLRTPPIVTAIQSCRLKCLYGNTTQFLSGRLSPFELYVAALPAFVNMRKLYLDYPNFSTAIVKHLSALPPLERVAIRLGSGIGTVVPDAYPLTITRHLTLITLRSEDVRESIMTIFDLDELESLHLHTMDQTKVLLPTHRFFPKLHILRINIDPVACWSKFCQLVSNCPLLEELRLFVASDDVREPWGLPPLTLPSLRLYSGPASLADLFMPERVVPHLHLRSGYSPSAFTSLATRSPQMLQSVQLVVEPQFLSEALEGISRFPCLQAFALEVPDRYDDAQTLAGVCSLLNRRSPSSRPLPRTIEYLSISFVCNDSTAAREELLQDAIWLQSFPRLQYLSFGVFDLHFNHQTRSAPLYVESIGDWVQREMEKHST